MNTRTYTLALLLLFSSLSNALAPSIPPVLDEVETPHFTGGTIDCGTNASNTSFEVEPYQPEWNASDTVSVFLDTYCGIWNNSYMVSWGLFDNDNNSIIIDTGNSSFETNTSSVTYDQNHTDHFNEVDIHLHYMDTGNYTVFGHFFVWLNNSWSFLSNESSTFEVNSTMTTTVCGYNSTFINMETDMQSSVYYAGSSVQSWSDVECPMLNTTYTYTWEMYNQNTSTVTHSGLQNFTATWQNVNMFTDGSGFYYDLYPSAHNLTEGSYLLNTTLSSASGGVIDTSNISFLVVANYVNNTANGSLNLMGINTNYTSGTTIQFNLVHTNLDVGVTYGETWWISDSSGQTISGYGWNQTWTANSTNHSLGASINNLSNGTYCITAGLYTVGANNSVTLLDTDTICFTIGTANQNTGCGYESSYIALYAYSWKSIFSMNETFESTINSYCNLLDSTTLIEWTVYYASNSTIVAQQNQSWYVQSTSSNWNITHNAFEPENYSFMAKLSIWDNATQGWNPITTNVYNFSYTATNGTSTSGELDIDTNGYNYTYGDTVTAAYESYNLSQGETYVLIWQVYDSNGNMVDEGNWTWMAYNYASVEWVNYTIDGAPLNAGTYCFYGMLYHADSNYTLTSMANDDTCIMIAAGNGTGNNTGGNNTGGNNTGGNNTGGNNTGGNNTGGNNTGGNNPNDCIDNNTPTGYLTELSIWTDKSQYVLGETTYGTFYVNCTLVGEDYQLRYWIDAGISYDSGWWNWTATQNTSVITMNWTLPDAVLGYHLHGELEQDGLWLANVESDGFDIVANNSGGNNAGNNTGGNNTGGNNTGGNNTGGNNTVLDSDGDGVLDADDLCPNSTPGASVDATGCEATVQPVNNAPEVTNVVITPLIATVDDTLTCGYSTTDADGDAVTTTVTWAVNGTIISAGSDTLSGGFGVGQTVTCSIVANDGAASSSAFTATTVILPSGSDDVVEDAGGMLPSLGMVGTLVAIAFGVGLSRRQDD